MRVDRSRSCSPTRTSPSDCTRGDCGGPRRGVGTRATGDTIALVAADGSGLAVSLIQSIFYGFGSGVLEPRTGILLPQPRRVLLGRPREPERARARQAAAAHADAADGRARWPRALGGGDDGRPRPAPDPRAAPAAPAGRGRRAGGGAAPRFIVGDAEPGAAVAVRRALASAWRRVHGRGRDARRDPSRTAASPAMRTRSRCATTARSTRAPTRARTGRRRPALSAESAAASTVALGPAVAATGLRRQDRRGVEALER